MAAATIDNRFGASLKRVIATVTVPTATFVDFCCRRKLARAPGSKQVVSIMGDHRY